MAGALGDRTVVDTSVHPPDVARLHYEFEGWLGDPVVESFPCFVATRLLADAAERAHLSGVRWDDVDVSRSDQFRARYPDRPLPGFRWMRVRGKAGVDDFGLVADHRLVVSERALDLLRAQGTRHAAVEEYA